MLRKCTGCVDKSRYDPATMMKTPAGWFHSVDCAYQCQAAKQEKAREKQLRKQKAQAKEKDRDFRRETKRREAAAKKRTGAKGYYEGLKKALHAWLKHGLRKGEPCYTCGKEQRHSDHGGAFHAGHYMPAKMVDPRRFMIDQLRMQCYSCNSMNSGRQTIFRQKLIEERGLEWVEWLECEANHASLKEQYPEVADIQAEAAGYRKLLRELNT